MRSRGDTYEQRALDMLQAAGLECVARNFNTRYGELDLVMRSAEALVFVEVRYRASKAYGGAAGSVTVAKQQKLQRAAELFLATHPKLARLPCRFDVVAFTGTAPEPKCDWIRAAFEAC